MTSKTLLFSPTELDDVQRAAKLCVFVDEGEDLKGHEALCGEVLARICAEWYRIKTCQIEERKINSQRRKLLSGVTDEITRSRIISAYRYVASRGERCPDDARVLESLQTASLVWDDGNGKNRTLRVLDIGFGELHEVHPFRPEGRSATYWPTT